MAVVREGDLTQKSSQSSFPCIAFIRAPIRAQSVLGENSDFGVIFEIRRTAADRTDIPVLIDLGLLG
jgi:hypothetical protein